MEEMLGGISKSCSLKLFEKWKLRFETNRLIHSILYILRQNEMFIMTANEK
jgi:hypothetical protein